jgi:hypothetical protein
VNGQFLNKNHENYVLINKVRQINLNTQKMFANLLRMETSVPNPKSLFYGFGCPDPCPDFTDQDLTKLLAIVNKYIFLKHHITDK